MLHSQWAKDALLATCGDRPLPQQPHQLAEHAKPNIRVTPWFGGRIHCSRRPLVPVVLIPISSSRCEVAFEPVPQCHWRVPTYVGSVVDGPIILDRRAVREQLFESDGNLGEVRVPKGK